MSLADAIPPLFAACPVVVAPGALYLTGEDNLRVRSFGSVASATLAVEGRMVDGAGRVVPIAERHVPNSDRTVATTIIGLAEGFLTNLHVRVTGATPRRGQIFVIVELIRGNVGGVQPTGTLLQGYVQDTTQLAWPGMDQTQSTEGAGAVRSITGTDPAANVEISETVPTNARWRLLCVSFQLVTDVNAANREVMLVLDDGTTTYLESPAGVDHAASLTKRYTFAAFGAVQAPTQQTSRVGILPPIVLQGGHRIRTSAANRQATDNYGAPQLLVEEWIED